MATSNVREWKADLSSDAIPDPVMDGSDEDLNELSDSIWDDIERNGLLETMNHLGQLIVDSTPRSVLPDDLTKEGVEPNPGPKHKKSKVKASKHTNKMNIGKKVKSSSLKVKGKGGFFEDAGSSVGSFIGKKAGGLLSSIFGMGDYTVNNNSLLNANNPPVLMNSTSGTIIRHREYVSDVLSSTGFALTSFPINVGISTTFPWLAAVAQSFEQYKMRGMIFEYKTLSGRALNSTNSALGTVIMATEYDATKPVFTDKRSMENYTYSTSCDPGTDAMHPVECATDVTPLGMMYVRSSGVTSATDLRFSDLGTFQLATVGMQLSGFIAGELWVTYEVELLKPRLPPTISSNPPMHYTFDTSLFVSSAGAPVSANLFGTTVQKFFLRGVSASTISLSGNFISFTTTGTYFVLLSLGGTTATLGSLRPAIQSGSALGTGTEISTFFSAGGTLSAFFQTPYSATSAASVASLYALNVTTASPSMPCQILYPSVTVPASISGAELIIACLPQGFTFERPCVERDELYQMVNQLMKRLPDEFEVLEMKEVRAA